MSKIVQLKKGAVRWFYRLISANGNILTTSQKYWSKSNARRAAKTIAHDIKAKYIES